MSIAPVQCVQCGKTYNPVLQRCPHCDHPRAVTRASEQPAPKYDYPALAEQFAQQFKALLHLDYSVPSILAVDLFIDETWGEAGAAPDQEYWDAGGKSGILLMIGAYVGECMIRTWGGEWIEDEAQDRSPLWAMTMLPRGEGVYVISKVFKRFKNGKEDEIFPLAHSLLSSQPLAPPIQSWLGQIEHFERVRRFDLALRFYDYLLYLPLTPEQKAEYTNRRQEAERQAQEAAATTKSEASASVLESIRNGDGVACGELEKHGIRPDRSAASLANIDAWLDILWGVDPVKPDEMPKHIDLARRLGFYLGELFRARLNGAWEPDTEEVTRSLLAWPSGIKICPFDFFTKRLEIGAGQGIFSRFEACRAQLRERNDIPAPGDETEEWLGQAEARAGARQPDLNTALIFAGKALELNPASTRAHVLAARWIMARDRDTAAAIAHLDQAIENHGDPGPIALERSRILRQAGDFDGQLAAARTLLGINPLDAEGMLLEAHALFDLNRLAEAGPAFIRALGANPTVRDRETWLRAGDCLAAAGDKPDALVCWQHAEDASAVGLQAAWRIAQTLEKDENWSESLAAYGKVLKHPTANDEWRGAAEERIRAIENDARFIVDEAVRAADAGDLDGALGLFDRALALVPADAAAWLERGVALARLGRPDEALESFRRAAEADPANPKPWDYRAVVMGQANRFADGVVELDRGLQLHPDSALLWTRRSIFKGRLGEWLEAHAAACRATECDPNHENGWVYRGEAERALEKLDAARESYRQFLKRVPVHKQPLIEEVSRTLWFLDHPGRKINPPQAAQLQDQAISTFESGRRDQGLQLFRQALEADACSHEIWNNYGSALRGAGRVEEALAAFTRAGELCPSQELYQRNRAIALEQLGRLDEALLVLATYLSISPRSDEIHERRIGLLTRAGRHEEAVSAAEEWTNTTPRRETAWRRKGWNLSRLSRHDEAIAAYDRAIFIKPHDREIWLEKASAFAAAGRNDAADALMAKAFEDKEFAEAWHRKGQQTFQALFH